MRLEYLGQYWNPETHRVHLLGKAEGVVHDLTPHLPYDSLRGRLIAALGDDPALPLLLEGTPFPTVQAVAEAERAGSTLPELLAPAWAAAQRDAERLDEGALHVQPDPHHAHLLACVLPLRAQAFGVTYENSALEREAEGRKEDYQYVYRSLKYRQERCEVFIKGTRLAHFYGPHGSMGLRSDLTNSVAAGGAAKAREPVLAGIEPELACVTYSDGRILGYTLANDVSGNLIENESILYLYQAKYFVASTGIGPWLWLSDEQDNPGIRFAVRIWDERGREVFHAEADSALIGLPIHALVAQAASHNALYPGEVFLTGTNIVPGNEAKVIRPDWRVEIRSERLGAFLHGAKQVSAAAPGNLDYHALELGHLPPRRRPARGKARGAG
jgi:Fumarylacetoacetate (FAA) hydrolase family